MKLRNKKTGQIGNFIINKDHFECVDLDYVPEYRNLAELTEEWEDYEEPKTINEIDVVLDAIREYCNEHLCYSEDWKKIKILNIVEDKLKAFKRLKDKGFKFKGYLSGDWAEVDRIYAEFPYIGGTKDPDLDLLFGGENDD